MSNIPSRTPTATGVVSNTRIAAEGSASTGLDHLRARLKTFLVAYVALMLAGLAIVVAIPSHYRAQSVIEVMSVEGMPRKLTTLDEQSYQKAVLSDDVLKAAVENLSKSSPSDAGSEYGAVRLLERSLSVSVDTARGRVQVDCQNSNPARAADSANGVAAAYVDLEHKRADASRKAFEPDLAHRDVLNKQVADKEKALRDAEAAVVAFDEESRSTVGNADLAAAREELERKILQARADLDAAQALARSFAVSEDNLKKELDATPEFHELPEVVIGPNPARTALEADIAKEERELSEMLKRYTEKHPLVIEKKSVIEMKKLDLAKMEQKVSDTETRAKRPNPLYQQAKQNYDQARQKLEETTARVEQQTTALKDAQKRLDALDERGKVRTRLAAAVAQAGSDLAPAKKELADCQDRLDKLESSVVVARVAEEAQKPTLPSGPERGWWTAVVFLVAVFGATGAAFAVSMFAGSFESAWEVERGLALPVLGNVSRVDEDQRRLRRHVRRGLELLTMLLLAAGVFVVVLLFVFESQIHGMRLMLFGN